MLAGQDAAAAELRAELDRLRRQLDDGPPPLTPVRRRRRTPLLGVLVVGGTLGVIATATLVPWSNLDLHGGSSSSAPAVAGQRATPTSVALAPLPVAAARLPLTGPGIDAPGSNLLVHITGAGTLSVVENAVLGPRGLRQLTLNLPSVASLGGEAGTLTPTVSDLRVAVNGIPVAVTPRPGGSGWTVASTSQRARTVQLSYRLDGALIRTQPSDAGRALAIVLPLLGQSLREQGLAMNVQAYGGGISGVTCPGAPATQMLCGSATRRGWTAAVPPQAASPALLLQLNLPSPSHG